MMAKRQYTYALWEAEDNVLAWQRPRAARMPREQMTCHGPGVSACVTSPGR